MHMGFVKGVDVYWVFMSPSAISFLWIEAWKFTFWGTHSPTLSPPGLDKTDPTPPSIRGNIWSCSRKVGYFIPLTTVIGLNRGMWLKKIQWNSHWNFFWIPSSHFLFSRSVMSDSLWPQGLRYARHPVLHHLPKLAQTHVLWVSGAIQPFILCRPLLLLPSIFPSIRVFSNELALSIRWPKYWSFSVSPSNEYSELTSFRIDWFDLLAVQGTLKIFSNTTV